MDHIGVSIHKMALNPLATRGKLIFHPLIHIPLGFALAQDVGKKKAEPKTPLFFSLNQDIVPWS